MVVLFILMLFTLISAEFGKSYNILVMGLFYFNLAVGIIYFYLHSTVSLINAFSEIKYYKLIYLAIATLCILANIIAFVFQFWFYELPCPLCLLQRFGFLGIGLGAMLTIMDTHSWKYDIIIILSSLFTLVVGLRQILLHLSPRDLGYGSTFFGLHFYTWSALLSFGIIAIILFVPLVELFFSQIALWKFCPNYMITVVKFSFIAITLINVISTYLECGFGACPSDPTTYLKL